VASDPWKQVDRECWVPPPPGKEQKSAEVVEKKGGPKREVQKSEEE